MDLLAQGDPLKLDDENWKIYTEDIPTTPQFIGENACLKGSSINQGCVVDGTVINSVLFRDVVIEKGAEIINSVICLNQ